MSEKEKLLEAAEQLKFEVTEEEPAVIGLPAGQTCQCRARIDGDKRTIFVGKPSQIQCAAMRAVLYFWKILRLVEAVATEDEKLNSYIIVRLDGVEDTVLDLPDEMRGGVVTPVRVMGNLILGRLNDDAFKTRGTMGEVEEVTQRKKFTLPDDEL